MDKAELDKRSRAFFDDLWSRGDPWELTSSEFERRRYARLAELLRDRRYGRVLEIGCGAGAFTSMLASMADEVVALDISETAIEQAKRLHPAGAHSGGRIDFRVANIMDFDMRAGGTWDLVVMTETIYYLGWLYSFFDVGWLVSELFQVTRPRGRVLLANTQGCADDMLMLPWLIRSYRDLFVNVGYTIERDEIFRGRKHDTEIEVMITLMTKGDHEG